MGLDGKYTLIGQTPVLEPDLLTWARWYETADRRVAEDVIGRARVSTVFLGLDHQYGVGPPILFETMIFGGELNGEEWRYSTWSEAESGHRQAVEKVRVLLSARVN